METTENSLKEIDDFEVLVKNHFKNYDSLDTISNEKFELQQQQFYDKQVA